MDWLAYLFNLPYTPWVIAGALILGTLLVAAYWSGHGRNLRSVVEEIRKDLGVSAAFPIRDEAELWNYYATEKFEAAKELLSSRSENDPLARQTLNYLNRCEPVEEAGSNRQRLETAVAPSDALRLSAYLMERNVQVPFYRAFPNYLVGVGLCITFLGLAVVIGKASSVLTQDNPGGSSLALHDLLVAASSKFWSSLTAVSCSIIYGIWFRKQSQEMERLVALLARDLGRCVKWISTDELHYESVQRLRKCEEYQSTTANKIGLLVAGMNDTQATSADQHRLLLEKLSAVADGLNGKLGQLGDDLGTKIGSMGAQVAGSLSNVNEKAFADIAEQMTNSLHKATEAHLKAISERLEAVSATLSKLPGEFEVLVGLVQENTTLIASIFANAVKPIEDSFAAASDSARDVALKFATLPDALEPARSAARDLSTAANTISELVSRIYSQNETVVKRWEELSSLIQDVDNHLAGAVESVGGVFPAYAEKLQDFSQKWESAMVAALGGLSANIKDLSASHEELRTQRTVWHDSADAVARSVDAVNVHLTRFTEELGAHNEAKSLSRQNTSISTDLAPAAATFGAEGSPDTGPSLTTALP
jgi:hypothetical protein